jgi:hypothetical protein
MAKKAPAKKEKDKSPAKPKLELSKTLEAFDRRNYDYYNSLPDDLKKQFAPFVLMRFMSSAPNQGGMHEYHLQLVNHFINKEFWLLSKHPDFQHLLLCLCGTGSKQFHKWIPANSKKNVKWLELFKEKYNNLSDLEIKIIAKTHDEQDILTLAMQMGKTDSEAQEYVKSFKENKI